MREDGNLDQLRLGLSFWMVALVMDPDWVFVDRGSMVGCWV